MSCAFTPDGKQVVTAHWGMHREGCPVVLWDVGKRERIRSLDEDANDTSFTALAIAPDGKTIALGGGWTRRNQGLKLVYWDLASGDEIGQVSGLPAAPGRGEEGAGLFLGLAYSPDGRTLAALLDGRILLIEIATGKIRSQLTFPAAGDVRTERGGIVPGALAFSPDGRTLAAGCSDGAVRRFDLRSGRELTPLPGHSSSVVALCYAPDGKTLHSYSVEGQFFVWRVESGREWKPKTGPLPDDSLDVLWDALRSDDPLDQFGSREALAAVPAQAVALLRKRVAPATAGDTERINRLVADLQKDDYNARKKAIIELRKIGAAALPALRKTQERGGFDELTRRLLFEFEALAPPPEQLRALRALAVLERIGDADSRNLLEELAGGSAEAALTLQAKSALERLGKAEPAKAAPTPQTLWEALLDEDATAAYRAIRALAAQPASAALMRERLKEIAAKDTFDDDPKRVAKLIADLDSEEFAVREQANKALRSLGRAALPALRKAPAAKPGRGDEAPPR